jgi:hypothetical protein
VNEVNHQIVNKIAAANGATNHSDLDFIAWHGALPKHVIQGIETIQSHSAVENVIFDLQGRRVNGTPRQGLYIMNGKKVMF